MLSTDLPKSAAPQAEFDFWLGTWDLRWVTPEGHPRAGTNVVTRALGGAAILESFSDPVGSDGYGYEGMSLSTYDASTGRWHQTWVDSAGSHLCFDGGLDGDRMRMTRHCVVDGNPVVQAMTWHSISASSIVWEWARSRDAGTTWELLWRIDYQRAEA
ncbi:MAG TPA: DUF1579 family protein [Mycobacteriales bacterium]|nr:DUF1579 family protein [Mycobacteriales bacterium]